VGEAVVTTLVLVAALDDQQLLPERNDPDRVRIVLRQLLARWLAALEQLPDGATGGRGSRVGDHPVVGR
jgi:hypothetical protein